MDCWNEKSCLNTSEKYCIYTTYYMYMYMHASVVCFIPDVQTANNPIYSNRAALIIYIEILSLSETTSVSSKVN